MNRKLIITAAIASGVLLAGCIAHGGSKTVAGEFGNVRSVSATVYAQGEDYIEFEDETGNLWLMYNTGTSFFAKRMIVHRMRRKNLRTIGRKSRFRKKSIKFSFTQTNATK